MSQFQVIPMSLNPVLQESAGFYPLATVRPDDDGGSKLL
jgi:hypothetical protein